jgi:membrane protease YdiL (CAAX protease family)
VVPAFAAFGIQLVWASAFSVIFIVGIGVAFMLLSRKSLDINQIDYMLSSESLFTPDTVYLVSATAILITGVVFFLWYLKITQFEVKGNYKKVLTVKNIAYITLLGIGSQFFTSGGMTLIQPLFEQLFEDYAQIMEDIVGGNPIVVIILVTLVAPISEELIFRGVMLKKLQRVLPFLGANILQAAVFGIYHWNIIQGVYAFGLGILLGYVANKYRSLVASIILHIAVNSSAFLMYLIPDKFTAYVILTIAGTAIIVICIRLIQQSNKSEGRI